MSSTKLFQFIAFIVVCAGCGTYAQYDEEEQCITPNGEIGNCISIRNCPILLEALQSGNPRKLQYVRQSKCADSYTPMVCCGTGNVRKARMNSVLPDRSGCGFQEIDKIVGGENADMDEYPWMARLQYQQRNGQKNFACAGSLISSRYVLTAAHCLMGAVTKKMGKLVNVRLGEWDTRTHIDCLKGPGMSFCNDPPVDVGIEKVIPHTSYSPNNINSYHDIGLIRLNRDVSYSNFVRPICLPLPNEASRVGEKLFVSGWGQTLTSSNSVIKQKVNVALADQRSCAKKFSSTIQLSNGQICAGGVKDKDSCKGDSGGPLMTTSRSDSSQWYIEGIVSFGAVKCGTQDLPGVYTKVSSYLDWIKKNVRN